MDQQVEGRNAVHSPNVMFDQHIVTNPKVCGGKPCIAGHRIRVQDIASDYERAGLSPDEICDAHPGMSLGQLHAALGYYFDHRDEITAEANADRNLADSFKNQHPNTGEAIRGIVDYAQYTVPADAENMVKYL